MIDSKPGFGLPLVYHLMQQGVLDLGPRVSRDVTPADGDTQWAAGPDLHRELTQAGAHSAGEPDLDLPQRPAEMLLVELVMERLEPVKQEHVARARTLAAAVTRPGRRIRMHRERQELALRGATKPSRNSGIQKPNHCLQHAIRSEGVAPMYAEDALAEAQHHRLVRVGEDVLDIPETECP